MKKLPRLLAGVFTATALAAAGYAQNRTFTNQYSFGDSLSDSGNLFAATSALGAGNPPAPYFQGRFSNGRTFVEQLGNSLALAATAPATVKSSLNFAFGGATASGTSALPPALTLQLGLFQQRAISVARTDLFTVLIGANDLIPVLTNPATPTNPSLIDSAGTAAAVSTANALQSLVGLGAKNIVIAGLPNLGVTPRSIAGGSTGQAFGLRATTAFNAELFARLRTLSNTATDVNFTYVDLQGILDRLTVDYRALGYANATSFVIAPTSAGGGGDPNGYVFFDDIHPTAKTHALLAAIVTEELNPEPVLGFASTTGTAALALQSLAANALDARVAQLGASPRRTGRGDVYASFNYGDGNRDAAGWRPKFNYTAQVVTAGADFRASDGVFLGGALNVGRLNAKLSAGAGNFSVEDNTGRLYAVWRGGPVSLTADGDFGTVRVKGIHRTTAFGGFQTNGKTDGTHWGAGLKAAWTLDAGGFSARPWLGLRTERVKLDAYSEKDVPSLSMDFAAQEAKSSAGGVGIDFGTDTKVADRALRFDFSAAWHGELSSRTRNVSGKLANNFTRTTTVGIKDGDGSGVALGAAATLAVAKNCSVTLGYAADLRSDDKLANRLSLSVQTGF
ncbi:MAG: autotransporter domain-containing protein [Verrucomicrobia bacterium]|nr:autotransporter domain-containing protein [Verrucomicrobiota bacterium]